MINSHVWVLVSVWQIESFWTRETGNSDRVIDIVPLLGDRRCLMKQSSVCFPELYADQWQVFTVHALRQRDCKMSKMLVIGFCRRIVQYRVFFECLLIKKLPSVLWHCWFGVRKSIWPVGWRVGVVICLEHVADCLHMVQLVPLHPKTPLSLAVLPHLNPYWFYLSGTGLPRLSW